MAPHDLLIAWLKAHAGWVLMASVTLFVFGLIAGIALAVRMPADYFMRERGAGHSIAHGTPFCAFCCMC